MFFCFVLCIIFACMPFWEHKSVVYLVIFEMVVSERTNSTSCAIAQGYHAIHPPSARMRTSVATAADVLAWRRRAPYTLSGSTTIQALAAPPLCASLSVWRTASGPRCSRISVMELSAVVTAGCLRAQLHTVLRTNRRVSNVRGAFLLCHGPAHTHTRKHAYAFTMI